MLRLRRRLGDFAGRVKKLDAWRTNRLERARVFLGVCSLERRHVACLSVFDLEVSDRLGDNTHNTLSFVTSKRKTRSPRPFGRAIDEVFSQLDVLNELNMGNRDGMTGSKSGRVRELPCTCPWVA